VLTVHRVSKHGGYRIDYKPRSLVLASDRDDEIVSRMEVNTKASKADRKKHAATGADKKRIFRKGLPVNDNARDYGIVDRYKRATNERPCDTSSMMKARPTPIKQRNEEQ